MLPLFEDAVTPQDDERGEEELPEDVLRALRRIADKSSPYSPYFDNMHEYQRRAESAVVEDWAQEIRKLGHSVCEIESNDDAPPDVLSVIDGRLTGIEVTTMVEYVREPQVRVRFFSGDSPPGKEARRMAGQSPSPNFHGTSMGRAVGCDGFSLTRSRCHGMG